MSNSGPQGLDKAWQSSLSTGPFILSACAGCASSSFVCIQKVFLSNVVSFQFTTTPAFCPLSVIRLNLKITTARIISYVENGVCGFVCTGWKKQTREGLSMRSLVVSDYRRKTKLSEKLKRLGSS